MNYDVNEVIGVLLELLGVIVVLAGGVKAIVYFVSPFRRTQTVMKKHEQEITEQAKRLSELEGAMEELIDMTKDTLKIQISLLNHMIDGNGVEEMKKLRSELQDKIL